MLDQINYITNAIKKIKVIVFAQCSTILNFRIRNMNKVKLLLLPKILFAVCVIGMIYVSVGMVWYHDIDDNLNFRPVARFDSPGGSKAVALAASIVYRESSRWTPNKPWIHPAYFLDNMPNYQLGIFYAISRFAIELGDVLGRSRGSSAIDLDLDRAAGLLKYDGRTWYWGTGNVIPTATAESQYMQGADALMRFNKRVAANDAVYERRADNLIVLLDRIASDLGSESAALSDQSLVSNAGYLDFDADDLFYQIKGRLYGYAMILHAIGEDFSIIIEEKQATQIWQKMLESLDLAAVMDPWVIANGKEDGFVIPSHLAAQGFALLRARTQLKELADLLMK